MGRTHFSAHYQNKSQKFYCINFRSSYPMILQKLQNMILLRSPMGYNYLIQQKMKKTKRIKMRRMILILIIINRSVPPQIKSLRRQQMSSIAMTLQISVKYLTLIIASRTLQMIWLSSMKRIPLRLRKKKKPSRMRTPLQPQNLQLRNRRVTKRARMKYHKDA